MITALTLCLAIYSGPTDTRPLFVMCVDGPITFDVTSCPGEVVEDDEQAVCEVTLNDE